MESDGAVQSGLAFLYSLIPLEFGVGVIPQSLKRLLCSVEMGAALMAAVALFAAYLSYYTGCVAGRPRVVGGAGRLKALLLEHCPILSKCYWPTVWAINRHLSTLARFLLQRRPKTMAYKRHVLVLSDGGEVALDWGVVSEEVEEGSGLNSVASVTVMMPVLLVVPGITGCSANNYVQHLVEDGLLEGYRPVVFNQRGNGGLKLKTLRTYSGSDISDMCEVVQHIQTCHPDAPIVGIGVSLGGMILTQYLHQLGERCQLAAAISISSSWNSFATRKSLENVFLNRWLYSRLMVANIKAMVKRNLRELTPEQKAKLPFNAEQLLEAKVVSDIDTHLTAPLFGFSCVEDYYRSCSNDNKLHKIRTPFICITSADDPFVPKESLPLGEFGRNPHTVLVVTSCGGHFGFVEGFFPRNKTWMDRAVQQILATFREQLL